MKEARDITLVCENNHTLLMILGPKSFPLSLCLSCRTRYKEKKV